MFYKWWRLDDGARRRVWRLYGWFTGLMLCGSCFGAVTWAAWMQFLVNFFTGENYLTNRNFTEWMKSFERAYAWRSAFTVTYAIEFLCLSTAKLTVLDRMSDFAGSKADSAWRRWALWGRAFMSAVVLGNAVGLAGNVAAAVYFQDVSEIARTSSSFFASDNPAEGLRIFKTGVQQAQLALSTASVQQFSEVVVLLLIVIAFSAAGLACARLITSRMLLISDLASTAAVTGRSLWLQMVGTTVFVFVAFVLRAAFATLYAITYQLQDVASKECPGNQPLNQCDATCYVVYTHISQWMFRTPEFQLMIVLISSPFALLVALWGMTTPLTLRLMNSRRRLEITPGGEETVAMQ